jgi:hypothetical protein
VGLALIQVVGCAGLGVVMRVLAVRNGSGNTNAAAVLYAAAGLGLLAMFAQEPEWDSATLLLRVAISLCLLGGFLVALPQLIRRILVTAFFVYHFVGISMAATALPIQRQPPGWINLELYERVYRHYLHFMYLTNAYHYYSPDPGPPQLLYFCIEYAPCERYPKGAHSWISIPKREDFRTRLEYQRRLGVTESTNDTTGFVPIPLQGVLYRYHNTQCYKVPGREALIIDDLELAHLGLTPGTMILKPSAYSQTMLRTYARYVATHYPLVDDNGDPVPGGKVSSVKVYKVTHNILSQAEFEKGKDPLDPDKYFPVFEGEFDPDGNLLPNDGFLYTPLPRKWVEDRKMVPENWKLLPEDIKEETDEYGRAHTFYLIDRMRMHGELVRRPYPDSNDKGTK